MAFKIIILIVLGIVVQSVTYSKFYSQNFLQQDDPAALSKEIIAYIMGDVRKQAVAPIDAYYNILDMIEDGTIFEVDGNPAIEELEGLIGEDEIASFIQKRKSFSDKILDEIIVDVGNCEATWAQANSQGQVMIGAGTITQETYEAFMIRLNALDLSGCSQSASS